MSTKDSRAKKANRKTFLGSNVEQTLLAEEFHITHMVGPKENGWRLDKFLRNRYQKRSRESLKRNIGSGLITIDRSQSNHLQLGHLKASSVVLEGDEVHLHIKRGPEPEVCFDYKVIFEDEWIMAIEKPANLPVHPVGTYFFHTLLTHLKTVGFTQPMSADRNFYLPHRIDKETSGVMILAKNKEVCASLVEQFAQRTTEKAYLAIGHGELEQGEVMADQPMGPADSKIRLKMAPCAPDAPGALTASTLIKRLKNKSGYVLTECHPKTGRQHQIRVHMEAIGHPLVGDKLYGLPEKDALQFFEKPRPDLQDEEDRPIAKDKNSLPPRFISPDLTRRLILPRHALHAHRLSFNHPVSGKRVTFESPLPQDLSDFFENPTQAESLIFGR